MQNVMDEISTPLEKNFLTLFSTISYFLYADHIRLYTPLRSKGYIGSLLKLLLRLSIGKISYRIQELSNLVLILLVGTLFALVNFITSDQGGSGSHSLTQSFNSRRIENEFPVVCSHLPRSNR
jgi:hypothetical protein